MSDGDFPTVAPRWRVYDRARTVAGLVQQAMELTIEGPHMDVPRAERLLERASAVLGQPLGESLGEARGEMG